MELRHCGSAAHSIRLFSCGSRCTTHRETETRLCTGIAKPVILETAMPKYCWRAWRLTENEASFCSAVWALAIAATVLSGTPVVTRTACAASSEPNSTVVNRGVVELITDVGGCLPWSARAFDRCLRPVEVQ